MTPEERAEKIIGAMGMHVTTSQDDRRWLAAQIRAAGEEAYNEALRDYKADGLDIAYKQGLEDAAKIAELHDTNHPSASFRNGYLRAVGEITTNLRARAAEVGK